MPVPVPVPVTMAWHGFGGQNRRLLDDSDADGEEEVRFNIRKKSAIQVWHHSTVGGVEFAISTTE